MEYDHTGSNADLIHDLCTWDSSVILLLTNIMHTIFAPSSWKFKKYQKLTEVPPADSEERNTLAREIVGYLGYFGSNNIAYLYRKICRSEPGVCYHEILYDVAESVAKKVKAKIQVPTVATTAEYEQLLTEMLLKNHLSGKTDEEIMEMFEGSNLERGIILEAVRNFCVCGGGGGTIVAFVKIVGKKVLTDAVRDTMIWMAAKRLGKEAATKLATQVFKKIAQKTISRAIAGVGWILLAYDVAQLTKPAYRITVPFVVVVSCLRMAERLSD